MLDVCNCTPSVLTTGRGFKRQTSYTMSSLNNDIRPLLLYNCPRPESFS